MKTKLYILFTIILVIGLVSTSCEGPMGPVGPEGPQGPPGQVGPAGADGSIIHAGNGAPGGDIGNPGDLYLDLSAGNLYGPRDAIGNWGTPLSLVGADGNDGEPGPQGPQGPQGPPGEDGEDGKDGQDGEDGTDGEDGEDGEDGKDGQDGEDGKDGQDGEDGTDGEDGADGEDGSQIFAGNGSPSGSLGKIGDYYLDKTSYNLYGPKTAGGWGTPINLQGPQGDPGPQGPPGTDGAVDHGVLTGLSDDDHLQYLLADGVRNATNGFAVTGTFRSGTIPIEGGGARLMWYPGKAAFRAGEVPGEQWNDDNIGLNSTAMGYSTTARGTYSTAIGVGATASGPRSTAMGENTFAGGLNSTAMGQSTRALGQLSTTMGSGTIASGRSSTAMGANTRASNNYSLAIGRNNNANTSTDNTLFVAGNGTVGSTSDALVLDFTGDLWIAGTLTEASDRRLKTDIQPLGMDVLGKLREINPVRYRFIEGTGHPEDEQIGLIAQEVQAHFPELVSEKSNGTLSLSYSKFSAVLLKGMQEQQAEIAALQSENKKIKKRLLKLEEMRVGKDRSLTSFSELTGVLMVMLILGGLFIFKQKPTVN